MTQIRPEISKKNPLYISKHCFLSAYHFALQYNDWKRQYSDIVGSAIRAVDYDDMPHSIGTGDPTSRLAIRSSALSGNIGMIEDIAYKAGGDVWQHLLYAVTHEGITYTYLSMGRCKELGEMRIGRNQYYQRRRLFYFMLYNRMEEAQVKS